MGHDAKASLNVDQEKALLLWLNSSLSILLYFGRRVITEGAWMQMKKPGWASMPVLDVRALPTKQLDMLAATYDAVATLELLPIAQLDVDENRHRIDEAISKVLGIQHVSRIRELLAREPGLSAKEINPRVELDGESAEEEDAEQGILI